MGCEGRLYDTAAFYTIPAKLVKAGKAVLTVRVSDFVEKAVFMARQRTFMVS